MLSIIISPKRRTRAGEYRSTFNAPSKQLTVERLAVFGYHLHSEQGGPIRLRRLPMENILFWKSRRFHITQDYVQSQRTLKASKVFKTSFVRRNFLTFSLIFDIFSIFKNNCPRLQSNNLNVTILKKCITFCYESILSIALVSFDRVRILDKNWYCHWYPKATLKISIFLN